MNPSATIAYARELQKLRDAERELTITLAKVSAGVRVQQSGGEVR